MFRRQKAEGLEQTDMFFESQAASNSSVANILSVGKTGTETTEATEQKEAAPEEATAEQLEADWGGDDDIDIDMGEDMLAGAEPEAVDGVENTDSNVESDIFVPPNAGADPITMSLKKNPQNVGLHVAGGEFTRALELLKKQLGINDFAPLR